MIAHKINLSQGYKSIENSTYQNSSLIPIKLSIFFFNILEVEAMNKPDIFDVELDDEERRTLEAME